MKNFIDLDLKDQFKRWAQSVSYCTAVMLIMTGTLAVSGFAGSDGVSIIHTPNGGEPVEARLGPDGVIHLLYDSKSNGTPYYVKSSDGGLTFSTAIPVVDKAFRKPGLRTGLIAIEASDGRALVAWKHQGELTWQLYSPDDHPEGTLQSMASTSTGMAGFVDKTGKFILFL